MDDEESSTRMTKDFPRSSSSSNGDDSGAKAKRMDGCEETVPRDRE